MSLYHKYRPDSLDDMIGNKQTIRALQATLGKDNPPHAYLFHGPTGCGKTTLGRIVRKHLRCSDNDFHEIDSADFRGIDTIREIRRKSQYKPMQGKSMVWLLDECHQLSAQAQEALLKALEEAPTHVYYILCTTDPQKLKPTLKGRCSQFQVNPLSDREMMKLLRSVVKAEGERLQKQVYEQIIQDSLGHPRNALQILDQVLVVEPDERLEVAKRQAEMQSQTIELCRALIGGAGWRKVRTILEGLRDQEPETIRRQVLGYCSSVLLKEENYQAAAVMEEFIEPFYNSGWPGLVFACFSIVSGGE